MIRSKILLCLFFIVAFKFLNAQDFVYNNHLLSPIYLNPALVGTSSGCNRLVINYRDQYPAIKNAYRYGGFSYDNYFDGIKGGIGVSHDHTWEGAGLYSRTSSSFIYSYSLRLNDYKNNSNSFRRSLRSVFGRVEDFRVNMALKTSYNTRSINYDNLIFYDQIDRELGLMPDLSSEASIPGNNSRGFLDFTAGSVFSWNYKSKFSKLKHSVITGFSVNHLTEPDESLISNGSYLKKKYNIHFTHFSILKNKAFIFTTAYYKQDNIELLNTGVQYKYDFVTIGQWYRHSNGFNGGNSFAVSVVLDDQEYLSKASGLSIGFSYDYSLFGIGVQNTAGAFEFSLIYQGLDCKSNNGKKIKCPMW